MSDKNLHEIYQESKEGKEGEIDELEQMGKSFFERDALPSKIIKKVVDASNNTIGYTFDFVMPWYMGQPVSIVHNHELKINGNKIKKEDVSLIIRGQKIPLIVAGTIHELWWSFGEVLQIYFENDPVMDKLLGKQAVMELSLELRTTIVYGFPNDMYTAQISNKMEVH